MNRKKPRTSARKPKTGSAPAVRFDGKDTLTIDLAQVPGDAYFFDATHYALDTSHESVAMLFGQRSIFSKGDRYHLALEIAMPRDMVKTCVHRVVKEPGLGQPSSVMASIEGRYNQLPRQDSFDIHTRLALPSEANSFRRFSATHMQVSIADQALIEFFEIPPNVVVGKVHNKPIRKGASPKNVVNIITNITFIKKFLDDLNERLQRQ